jgi:type II secretory pathway component PulC
MQVATGDHGVPEIQLAQIEVSKPLIKHEALFGEYQGSKPLQETGLNLQLSAVFAMGDPTKGSAVISASGRKPLLQVVGDVMPGGVKLKEVHTDYVVLEQAGQQSILRLPKKSL